MENKRTDEVSALQKRIRFLEEENRRLTKLLEAAGIDYGIEPERKPSEPFDPDQGARIKPYEVKDSYPKQFFDIFCTGRRDVFVLRHTGQDGKVGYYPQCHNRWDERCHRKRKDKVKCKDCEIQSYKFLGYGYIKNHMIGASPVGNDVVAIYPMLPGNMCKFLVFDFDNHEKDAERNDFANTNDDWKEEVNALWDVCDALGIDARVERSRSGRGAHLWIFFKEKIPARKARRFGFSLIEKGAESVNLTSFRYYDRMLPHQDALPEGGFGNAIALPLQGQALKRGNSAFIDRNWNAYRDQLDALRSVKRLAEAEIDGYIARWQMVPQTNGSNGAGDKKPWEKNGIFSKNGVSGAVNIRIEDRIYIDTTNISSGMQWQIRKMAAFKNKQFFINLNSGEKNYDTPAVFYIGDDEGDFIVLPRGLEERLLGRFKEAGIEYSIKDAQSDGRKVNVEFMGSFRGKQEQAFNALMGHEKGMLHAATSFGKTVIGCALIAKRAVNTLIIVDNTRLKDQWLERIGQFLAVNEEPPEYKTKTGRVKKRLSPVGELEGGKDKLTGIIDVAMIRSLKKKNKGFHPLLTEYGMVIFDECHHAASDTATEVLKEITARYVYGVSATIQRSDGKSKALEMLIGPIRYRYSSKDRALEMGIPHLVYPRFTRTVELHRMNKTKFGNEAFDLLRDNEVRDAQIIRDINESVKNGRTPVVLSNYVEHAKKLYDELTDSADVVVLLIGAANNADREKEMEKLRAVKENESLILVGTGKLIGEGFDFPRLDTLFVTMPVSGETVVEQYAGRIGREYKGKENVLIYDYVDWHIDKFAKMFSKRSTIYKKIGYEICGRIEGEIPEKDAIYDIDEYQDVFWNDLENVKKDIVISSQRLNSPKVKRLISVVERRQELGVKVVVVTWSPDYRGYGKSDARMALMESIRKAGIRLLYVEDVCRQYAVIDRDIVWHGSVNLLGKEDVEDNLIRITDKDIAVQLLEETFSGELEEW